MNTMQTRTTTALLEGLCDPANEPVWQTFDQRYRPVLLNFARRLGLPAEDAADAMQEALLRFLTAFRAGKYQRGRGRLSSWILGIARNCVLQQWRTRAARHEARGTSAAADLPQPDEWTPIWNAECMRAVFREALETLRRETRVDPRTVRAFELLALEQLGPGDVAAALDMSRNDVYLAKHRCLKRLRPIVARLAAAYELN